MVFSSHKNQRQQPADPIRHEVAVSSQRKQKVLPTEELRHSGVGVISGGKNAYDPASFF